MSRNYAQLRERVDAAFPDATDGQCADIAVPLEKALSLMDVLFGPELEKKDPRAAAAFLAPLMPDVLREAREST